MEVREVGECPLASTHGLFEIDSELFDLRERRFLFERFLFERFRERLRLGDRKADDFPVRFFLLDLTELARDDDFDFLLFAFFLRCFPALLVEVLLFDRFLDLLLPLL